MSKVEQLKRLLTDMDYQPMIEVLNCSWYRSDNDFTWNTDDNLDDLHNGDGNTYSGYEVEGAAIFDNHVVVNLDTQMGYWVTHLFPLSKEVPLDD